MSGTRRLRIGLNGTAAVTGGGLTYWLNLIPALARVGRDHDYVFYVSSRQTALDRAMPDGFTLRRVRFPRPPTLMRVLWEQAVLPGRLRRDGVDVLLAAADMAPLRAPCPVVVAMRNPAPYYGTLYGAPSLPAAQRARLWALRRLSRASARVAAHVYFVSEDSRSRIGGALGVPPSKTSVVYHGLGAIFQSAASTGAGALSATGSGAPYFLCVSALYPHKDFETMIRAYASWRSSAREPRHRLVIAGALADPEYASRLRAMIDAQDLTADVELRGEIAYADLPALYRGATLFLLSSTAETFGHPLLEAMASGVPVIVTDMPVTREICGEAADYFAPGDGLALGAAMSRLLGEGPERARLIAAGRERAAWFSWDRCARATLDLLERAAEHGISEPGPAAPRRREN